MPSYPAISLDIVQLTPATSKITPNAPGFIGQAMISPALWISRMSAPALSQGVLTVMPVFSETSSSMNSMLSLATSLFMPVEEPTFSCRTEPLSWSSFGAMPISWLKSLRISWVIKPLSTPIGQVWAHRRQRLHR